jgi:hypothetical protein
MTDKLPKRDYSSRSRSGAEELPQWVTLLIAGFVFSSVGYLILRAIIYYLAD